jgi:hypothetical protein
MRYSISTAWEDIGMKRHIFALSLFVSSCIASLGVVAEAADLTGVWSTDAAVCNKVFVKEGNKVSFAKDAELSGGGFIIEGGHIRGPTASCRIKATKEEGAVTHMVASCATDIMLSDVQLSVKIVDANKITRLFPSMPEMETNYYRCSF